MQVETLDARTLTEDKARSLAELVVRVWPKPNVTVEMRQQRILEMIHMNDGNQEQAPRIFFIREAGKVIAQSTFVTRTIGTTQGELTIAGLARVCSDPDIRGKGLGRLIVEPVFQLVDQGVFPFSLFQTTTAVRPFYEKLNCYVVDNPIVNSHGEDPRESPFWDNTVMRYPSGPGWPEGEIDMRGPGY